MGSDSTAKRTRQADRSVHVDFVLCDPDALTPLLVIELDDSSHERTARRDRDAFLGAAGLPILHVAARHAYAPTEIRALINDRLNEHAEQQIVPA